MHENGSKKLGRKEQLAAGINALIEKAEPGTSEFDAMLDFSNVTIAGHYLTMLDASIEKLDNRNVLIAYIQIVRIKHIVNDINAEIDRKSKTDTVYKNAMNLMTDTIGSSDEPDSSLSPTKNVLLTEVLKHSFFK